MKRFNVSDVPPGNILVKRRCLVEPARYAHAADPGDVSGCGPTSGDSADLFNFAGDEREFSHSQPLDLSCQAVVCKGDDVLHGGQVLGRGVA